MTNVYNRDNLGRLTGVSSTLTGGGNVSGVDYQLDHLNRRFEASLVDGTKWDYGYNDRSEVISGKKKLASNAFAGGAQFEYDFDDIGNRTISKVGGDMNGANLRSSTYTNNALNQIEARAVPGSVWVMGEAATNVTLQGIADGSPFVLHRQDDERFYGEALATNESASVFARLVVAGKTNGTLTDVQKGYKFVAATPETFTYDDDGNLTQDGRWVYAWDAESRLVTATARTDVPEGGKRKLEFVYDFQGRRVQKVVHDWNGSGYSAQTTNRFIYDGWNLLATLDGQSNLLQSFVWGLDLSGTLQGAGGVGGLLQVSFLGSSTTNCYTAYDGNGNVTALVDATNVMVVAKYEYGPFGELVTASGPLAKANPFRFSTKYQDEFTDLYYYGYRYYNPSTGKWMSMDPSGEAGGMNLYGMVDNDAVNYVDNLGLSKVKVIYKSGERIIKVLTLETDDAIKMLKRRVEKGSKMNSRTFVQTDDPKKFADAISPTGKSKAHPQDAAGHPAHRHPVTGKSSGGNPKTANTPHVSDQYTGSSRTKTFAVIGISSLCCSKAEAAAHSQVDDDCLTEILIDLTPIGDIKEISKFGKELTATFGAFTGALASKLDAQAAQNNYLHSSDDLTEDEITNYMRLRVGGR